MAYVFSSVSGGALGCPGCGGTCGRRATAASHRTLGEWYVREEPEEDADDEDRRPSASAGGQAPTGGQAPPRQPPSLGEAMPVANPLDVITGFEFDRSGVPNAEHAKLVRLARFILAGHRGPFRVIGHTDPVGTDAYNMDLGLRRAKEVQRRLIITLEAMRPGSSRGVIIAPASAGERRPVAPNTSEQSRARNRRVEIVGPMRFRRGP
jgi:outer membrane protein OmpA-like peptidoglycan-associated protein